MRQSNSGRRGQQEYGYLPKSSTGGRNTGGSITPNPDIIINGRDSSVDSVGSGGIKLPHGFESSSTPTSRLGAASNPNRAEMPDTGRRKSYDQVSDFNFLFCFSLACGDSVHYVHMFVHVRVHVYMYIHVSMYVVQCMCVSLVSGPLVVAFSTLHVETGGSGI